MKFLFGLTTLATRRGRLSVGLSLAALVSGCAAPRAALPPAPNHANGQALWRIVYDHCLPGQRDTGDPAPCNEVSIAMGVDRGYVVLKDRVGASQYLVMPTILISGIEDPRLLRPDSTDYFTPAWRARRLVAMQLHATLARDDVGIAVNSAYGRTQDLLHLHVDCLKVDVRTALRRSAPGIGYRWAERPLILDGHAYRAVRIDGPDTVAADPFRLLARGLHVGAGDMAAWTLVLAGMDFADGKPGFLLLAARAAPSAGFHGSGEELQDHACSGRDK